MPHAQSIGAKSTRFKKLIIDGQFYLCVVYKRCLCKRFVIQFHEDQFQHLISGMYIEVDFFDEEKYICKTESEKGE